MTTSKTALVTGEILISPQVKHLHALFLMQMYFIKFYNNINQMWKRKSIITIDLKYLQFTDTTLSTLKTLYIQHKSLFYAFYILLEDSEADTFHSQEQIKSIAQLDGFATINHLIQLGSIAERAKVQHLDLLLVTNRPKFFNYPCINESLSFKVFPIKYSDDINDKLWRNITETIGKSPVESLATPPPTQDFPISSINTPTTETIIKDLRKMWVLSHNIPSTIGPLANMVHDVGSKLKPVPASLEEEYSAFQQLFFEGYFESPLLLDVMKKGIAKSIESVKSLVHVKPTEKLREFIAVKMEAPVISKVEEVKMSREEAHTTLKMVQEILGNFVSQYKEKEFKNIKKIGSLQSHFRNQLLTYSAAKVSAEFMCRLRNDNVFLDYLVGKMLQCLLNKAYIKCFETKVLYNNGLFNTKNLVVTLEDIGFDPSKDVHHKSAHNTPAAKAEDIELKKLVLQMTEAICNHFIENCLKCLWDNIKKTSSLKNHFTNLIKQSSVKSMGVVQKVKADTSIQELIIGNILRYLTEKGYLVIAGNTVTYNHKAFENKQYAQFTLDTISMNPGQLQELINKPKIKPQTLLLLPATIPAPVEEKKEPTNIIIEEELLGKIKKKQIVIPKSVGELHNAIKKIVQEYIGKGKLHVDSQEQAIIGIAKHLFASKQIYCDKIQQECTFDSLKKAASARVEFLSRLSFSYLCVFFVKCTLH
eukprot:TRINITY_DN1890_c0_g1_i2.p1 TRINITY_DN1890_c0_g1~~TRINITY_DN1890_c0_g1_i2.p1  ORF type:complete len:703 (-),score=96.00 TRINITY_DN1890_c0_g1_i2:552-2660(-)